MAGSSTSATVRAGSANARFRSPTHAKYFKKLKKHHFTESRVLDQSKLKHDITTPFENSSLLYLLTMAFPFNSTAIKEIYANLEIDDNFTTMTSRVMNRDVEFSKQDLHTYLFVSMSGENIYRNLKSRAVQWRAVNQSLRDIDDGGHIGSTKSLTSEAHLIQHVLRNSILPKAGDRDNITPPLTMTTYYILENVEFDAASLLIGYISSVMSTRLDSSQRLQNLVLGHMFAFLLECKYGLVYNEEADSPPIYYSNSSFNVMLKPSKRARTDAEAEEADFERQAMPPPSQGSSSFSHGASSSFDLSGLQESLGEKFDMMQGSILSHVDARFQELRNDIHLVDSHVEEARRDVRSITDEWHHFRSTYYPDYHYPPAPPSED